MSINDVRCPTVTVVNERGDVVVVNLDDVADWTARGWKQPCAAGELGGSYEAVPVVNKRAKK